MKLQEVFDQLSIGEFSKLSIGGQDAGVIDTRNYKDVLTHLNLGLATLYRRFHLKEGTVVVEIQPGQKLYPLRSDFAVANRRSRQEVRYIKDTAAAPFSDDIHKIVRVNTDCNQEMALNDVANHLAVLTPSMSTISVPDLVVNQTNETPYWLRTKSLNVIYRANHPLLAVGLGIFDPTRIELELPYTHLTALLYFVASRIHNPIGMTNEFHAGNNYAAKFEQECRELEGAGMQVQSSGQEDRLHRKGFV